MVAKAGENPVHRKGRPPWVVEDLGETGVSDGQQVDILATRYVVMEGRDKVTKTNGEVSVNSECGVS